MWLGESGNKLLLSSEGCLRSWAPTTDVLPRAGHFVHSPRPKGREHLLIGAFVFLLEGPPARLGEPGDKLLLSSEGCLRSWAPTTDVLPCAGHFVHSPRPEGRELFSVTGLHGLATWRCSRRVRGPPARLREPGNKLLLSFYGCLSCGKSRGPMTNVLPRAHAGCGREEKQWV